MPNTHVPAAGEALPAANLNRRLALLGGLTAAAALAVMSRAQAAHDPLLDAIGAYRAGLADFNTHSPEDDDAADRTRI